MTDQRPSTEGSGRQPAQPAAAPSPGPYTVESGEIRGQDGRKIADVKVNAVFEANAELLRASWETAAERDRLVGMNKLLVDALTILRPMCGFPNDYTIGDIWRAQKLADTALAAARPPQATGGAGG